MEGHGRSWRAAEDRVRSWRAVEGLGGPWRAVEGRCGWHWLRVPIRGSPPHQSHMSGMVLGMLVLVGIMPFPLWGSLQGLVYGSLWGHRGCA